MTLIEGFAEEAQLLAEAGNCYPIENWDDDTLKAFLYELIGIGIRTPDDFTRRFAYTTKSSKPYEDFTWYYYWDLRDLGDELIALHGLCIDYTRTWESYLSSRYVCFRFKGETSFFLMPHLSEH